jgi:hypothetical protein
VKHFQGYTAIQQKNLTPEELTALLSPKSIGLRDKTFIAGTSGKAFTASDAALAHAGLSPVESAAHRFKWAGDWSGLGILSQELTIGGLMLARREGWPERLPNGDNWLQLAGGYLLHEIARPSHYSNPVVKAAFFGLDSRAWLKKWQPRYEALVSIFDNWCYSASDSIRQWLND